MVESFFSKPRLTMPEELLPVAAFSESPAHVHLIHVAATGLLPHPKNRVSGQNIGSGDANHFLLHAAQKNADVFGFEGAFDVFGEFLSNGRLEFAGVEFSDELFEQTEHQGMVLQGCGSDLETVTAHCQRVYLNGPESKRGLIAPSASGTVRTIQESPMG